MYNVLHLRVTYKSHTPSLRAQSAILRTWEEEAKRKGMPEVARSLHAMRQFNKG